MLKKNRKLLILFIILIVILVVLLVILINKNNSGTKIIDIHLASVSSIESPQYIGAEPKLELTYNGKLIEGADYTIAYRDNDKLGEAAIIITGIGKYGGKKVIKFPIVEDSKKISIENAKVTGAEESYIYDGKEHKPEIEVWLYDQLLTYETDYIVEYGPNIDVGEGTINISGIGKYDGIIKVTFDIIKIESKDRCCCSKKDEDTGNLSECEKYENVSVCPNESYEDSEGKKCVVNIPTETKEQTPTITDCCCLNNASNSCSKSGETGLCDQNSHAVSADKCGEISYKCVLSYGENSNTLSINGSVTYKNDSNALKTITVTKMTINNVATKSIKPEKGKTYKGVVYFSNGKTATCSKTIPEESTTTQNTQTETRICCCRRSDSGPNTWTSCMWKNASEGCNGTFPVQANGNNCLNQGIN